jgi:hypothetical protein
MPALSVRHAAPWRGHASRVSTAPVATQPRARTPPRRGAASTKPNLAPPRRTPAPPRRTPAPPRRTPAPPRRTPAPPRRTSAASSYTRRTIVRAPHHHTRVRCTLRSQPPTGNAAEPCAPAPSTRDLTTHADARRRTQTHADARTTHADARRRTQTHADARRRTQTHADARRRTQTHADACGRMRSPHPLRRARVNERVGRREGGRCRAAAAGSVVTRCRAWPQCVSTGRCATSPTPQNLR